MKRVLLALLLLLAAGGARSPAAEPSGGSEPAIALVNGHWFDGTRFRARPVFVVNGVLAFDRPARVGSTIDLLGGYVVPPFGEAHNHNVEAGSSVDTRLAAYLRDGVFYVKNPNSLPGSRAALAGKIDQPTSIDVLFAQGGWTGSGGHPIGVVERNVARGVWSAAEGEGRFYWTADSEEEIDRKWPSYLAQRPDFVKVYLLHAEDYARRRADSATIGWRGLDPRLLPRLVRRAHRAGLSVSAHVETAADFHAALEAAVDEINHLPGFRGNEQAELPDPSLYWISDADARRAARRGVVVVTTVSGAADFSLEGPESLRRRRFDDLHRRNLQTLQRHGVRLAVGSDSYGDTSVGEVAYLRQLGVLSDLELLRLWAEATPRAIFPKRRIGRLAPGFEASFLVLEKNPLEDWSATARIRLRMKQGQVIAVPSP